MEERYFAELKRFFEQRIRFNAFLGFVVEELAPGRARMRMPYQPDLLGDPFRPSLHGGAMASLLDAAGGLAVLTRLKPGETCHTVDLRVDYLIPGEAADLVAEARVIRVGGRVAVVNLYGWQKDPAHHVVDGKAVYNVRRARVDRVEG